MVRVSLVNVTKRYGKTLAVDGVNLEIRDGELFTFLGPSGCGKTTTLRLIAGFEFPDEGKIMFDEKDVTVMKPYERNTAMVFQNYALWPHMTVFDNVAYGLKIRRVPKGEIRERVRRVLELVKLEGLENRYPNQLSGGQQQRVALARALVVEPHVLLLDEPLSNLDAKLRIEMREEIKRIQKKLSITTIYVTHDQEEAMSISDRIAVMDKGRVLQVDTPENIYFRPTSLFVATFIGKTSVLEGLVEEDGDRHVVVRLAGSRIQAMKITKTKLSKGRKVRVVIRPEFFRFGEEKNTYNKLRGIVDIVMFVGSHKQLKVTLSDGQQVIAFVNPDYTVRPGQEVELSVEPSKILVYTE